MRSVRVTLAALGIAAIGYGLARVATSARPLGQLRFLATVLIGHDLVLLPLAIAIPFVIGAGRRPDDPSALPLPYWRGPLVVLGVIWAVAVIPAARRRAAARRSEPGRSRGGGPA